MKLESPRLLGHRIMRRGGGEERDVSEIGD